MKKLTEFEKLALEEFRELSNHIAMETSRLVDEIINNWKSALYGGYLKR